jgi:hypothetical protein
MHRFKRAARLVLSSNSAMPVDQSDEQLPAPSDSSFSSQVKPVRESNGENGESTDSSDSDTNAESAQQGGDNTDKPKRAWSGRADYRLVKTWDIGENRTQDIEESRHKLYLMSSKFFEDTKTLKLPTHKSLPTDIHMWKQYCSYKSAKSDALIRIFRCPMKTQTDCPCCIKTIDSTKSLELYFLGEHGEKCHAVDKSAYLKVKQIVAIVDGVNSDKYAPQQVLLRKIRI